MGWIGVDLDGTLAEYGGTYLGPTNIGPPVPAMLERVKGWLEQGYEVRIFTARACMEGTWDYIQFVEAMHAWCLEHIGQTLKVTCVKDFGCIFIVDDRAMGVEPNTGRIYHEPAHLSLRPR